MTMRATRTPTRSTTIGSRSWATSCGSRRSHGWTSKPNRPSRLNVTSTDQQGHSFTKAVTVVDAGPERGAGRARSTLTVLPILSPAMRPSVPRLASRQSHSTRMRAIPSRSSLSNDAGGLFAIDAATGVVTVADSLEGDREGDHTITVRATDSHGETSETDFTIEVGEVDEASMAFGTGGIDTFLLDLEWKRLPRWSASTARTTAVLQRCRRCELERQHRPERSAGDGLWCQRFRIRRRYRGRLHHRCQRDLPGCRHLGRQRQQPVELGFQPIDAVPVRLTQCPRRGARLRAAGAFAPLASIPGRTERPSPRSALTFRGKAATSP